MTHEPSGRFSTSLVALVGIALLVGIGWLAWPSPLPLDPMPSVAMGFPLDLLLVFQLFHPFLFSRGLLRLMPFLGLTRGFMSGEGGLHERAAPLYHYWQITVTRAFLSLRDRNLEALDRCMSTEASWRFRGDL